VILLVTRQAEGQIGHAGKMVLCRAASLSSEAGSASAPTMVANVPISPANRAPQPQSSEVGAAGTCLGEGWPADAGSLPNTGCQSTEDPSSFLTTSTHQYWRRR
jgi:hypothetical protein